MSETNGTGGQKSCSGPRYVFPIIRRGSIFLPSFSSQQCLVESLINHLLSLFRVSNSESDDTVVGASIVRPSHFTVCQRALENDISVTHYLQSHEPK